MNSASPDPHWGQEPPGGGSAFASSKTPNQLLADRKWRLQHSVWMLGPIVSFGMITWASFLYIGVRARRRDWQVAGVLYAIGVVIVLIFTPSSDSNGAPASGSAADWTAGLLIALWVAGVTHAFLSNKSWLRWRAQNSTPWYVTGGAEVRGGHKTPGPSSLPPQLSGLGIDSANYYSQQHLGEGPSEVGGSSPRDRLSLPSDPPAAPRNAPAASFTSIDVNIARASELAALPGFNDERAKHAVAVRERLGGFNSIQQFADSAGLLPHEHHRVRSLLTCTPPNSPPDAGPASGRVVDF